MDEHQGWGEEEDGVAEAFGLAVHGEDASGDEINGALGLFGLHGAEVEHHGFELLDRLDGGNGIFKTGGGHHHHLGKPGAEGGVHGGEGRSAQGGASLARTEQTASVGTNTNAVLAMEDRFFPGLDQQPFLPSSEWSASVEGLPSTQRLDCVSGFDELGSTSLKWGANGELTALDLHGVLARLCVHDPEACRLLDGEP